MTRINLLPWRQQRREYRQRRFMGILAGVVILAALGVLGAHLFVQELINQQTERNNFLRQEIAKLNEIEKEIKEMQKTEASLLARLDTIKKLQSSRPDMVRALDSLVRSTPEDVYFTTINIRGKNLQINGNARVNNVVSDFMREFEESPLYNESALQVIENRSIADNVPASVFQLNVTRK